MADVGKKRPNSNSDVPEEKKFREEITEMESAEENLNATNRPLQTDKDTPVQHFSFEMKAILEKLEPLECLGGIKESIQEMQDQLKDLKNSFEYTQKELEELKCKSKKQDIQLADLRREVDEIGKIKGENAKLKKQLLSLETYNRRENLIFENIPETASQYENCDTTLKVFFAEKLGLVHNIRFQRVHRLGQKSQTNGVRPIIARFVYFPDREEVWRARSNLKGTNYRIREDFPEEIESERRTLLPIFIAARKQKEMKAKLVGNRLIVNSETYTTENLHQLPAPLLPRAVSERVITNDMGRKYHCFHGKLSPFSNMYESPFVIKGVSYPSVEHYYTHEKAIFAKQHELAEKVLVEKDPIKVKRLSKKLQVNHKVWISERGKQAMVEGVAAKFEQNRALISILKATQGHTLVECNPYDSVWGVGVGLYSEEAQDFKTWKGDNQLGSILTEVRDKLR